jgi:thioredoxin-like negative regulator of GroEL
VDDDFEGALALARREQKLVLVDAWAPWCHTCLSMRSEVLSRPELGRYEAGFVFAALDTDRPDAASFLARYRVRVWPTFFVIDPASGAVLAMHGGAMSLPEMAALLEEAERAASSGGGGPGAALLARAHEAYAGSDLREALRLYREAASLVGQSRRAEALLGAIRTAHEVGDAAPCFELGREEAASVPGGAAPGDFMFYVFACAKKLPEGAARAEALAFVRERFGALTARPPEGASVDDRADLFAMAAEAERVHGDEAAARSLDERRLAMLEDAARAARSPVEAQVFDYARLGAYIALGRGEAAVRMLEARTKELPSSYEAHARLGSALLQVGRPREALGPLDRAIGLSYGPRRLRYLGQKSSALLELGDRKAAIEALRAEVAGWEALPEPQRDPARLADAKKRLEAAEALKPSP